MTIPTLWHDGVYAMSSDRSGASATGRDFDAVVQRIRIGGAIDIPGSDPGVTQPGFAPAQQSRFSVRQISGISDGLFDDDDNGDVIEQTPADVLT